MRSRARSCSGSVMVRCLAHERRWRATTSPAQVTTTSSGGDPDLDQAADHLGVDRVVAGPDAHPVVPGEAGRQPQGGVGQHRRERHHGRLVLLEAVDRTAPQRGVDPAVGPHQPLVELGR